MKKKNKSENTFISVNSESDKEKKGNTKEKKQI